MILIPAASARVPLTERLAWLAGSWHSEQADGAVGDQVWLAPVDGTMVGVFRLVKHGKLQFTEHLIVAGGDKGLTLTIRRFGKDHAPLPADKGGVERYVVTRAVDGAVTFETLDGKLDKITYTRTKTGMTVQVVPKIAGAKPVEFHYKKR